jgi:hypothetical protein
VNIRYIELVPRTLEAIKFEGNDNERRDIRQYVQDRTPEGNVVMSHESLYIIGVSGTEKVELGEWILFDVTDQNFRSATDGAILAFYRDVDFGDEPNG